MIRMDIVNDGTGTEMLGNYDVTIWMPGERIDARVEGFDRRRGWSNLVQAALAALVWEPKEYKVKRDKATGTWNVVDEEGMATLGPIISYADAAKAAERLNAERQKEEK